ncbi:MAG: pseudouridine synthase [Bacteroidetes bacterium]|nr:MAG: pseudouridine synthase [Bacteroidota bacterium]
MAAFKYFIVYKPYLVLSQFSPVEGKETLADYFTLPKDVYPIGRLDADSEGLLLLSNDKAITEKLLHPRSGHQREYWAQVEGIPTSDALTQLSKGVSINIDGKNHQTLPATAVLLSNTPLLPDRDPPIRYRASIPTSWLSLTLSEGKNRQVRKMTAAVGLPTLRLVRWRIEKIDAAGMLSGDLIEMGQKEFYHKLKLKG